MQANNGIGGTGVAYNAQIMAIKAAQYSGLLSATDVSQAIYYAVEKGADVIITSFGGYNNSQIEEDALAVAFGQAVLVAAAGNDGLPNAPCSPQGQCIRLAIIGYWVSWPRPELEALPNLVTGIVFRTTFGNMSFSYRGRYHEYLGSHQ